MRRELLRTRSSWAWVLVILVERVARVFSNSAGEKSSPYFNTTSSATGLVSPRWRVLELEPTFQGQRDTMAFARLRDEARSQDHGDSNL